MEVALEASIETIKIVHRIGDRLELLGAWWFTLYYIHSLLVYTLLHQVRSRTSYCKGEFYVIAPKKRQKWKE
ncbi:hypothetical protein V1521DRAFT_439193 [Lipomyces starkeyi]